MTESPLRAPLAAASLSPKVVIMRSLPRFVMPIAGLLRWSDAGRAGSSCGVTGRRFGSIVKGRSRRCQAGRPTRKRKTKTKSQRRTKQRKSRTAPPRTRTRTSRQADNAAPKAPRPSRSRNTRRTTKCIKDAETIEGLITLHRKDDQLFAELGPRQLDRDYIVLITIARGIGQTPIVGGFSWGFGDDAVWQFRKAGENIQLVRRNVRFTAERGSPTEKAVAVAYTDSVLFSLPIRTRSPQGAYVVDLTPVFMSDLPQIVAGAAGLLVLAAARSTWAEVNGFPKNVELQVAATYASSGMANIDSVPDSRGVTVNVHYSISELPATSYRPRLADDRVGYFLTVLKDFSKKESDDDRFVRYITRWNLEKADPQRRDVDAQGADHLLAGEDDSVQVSQADSRRHPGMEQGLREGRLLRRDRSAAAAGRCYRGSRATFATTRSAGSRRAPALRWAPRA